MRHTMSSDCATLGDEGFRPITPRAEGRCPFRHPNPSKTRPMGGSSLHDLHRELGQRCRSTRSNSRRAWCQRPLCDRSTLQRARHVYREQLPSSNLSLAASLTWVRARVSAGMHARSTSERGWEVSTCNYTWHVRKCNVCPRQAQSDGLWIQHPRWEIEPICRDGGGWCPP